MELLNSFKNEKMETHSLNLPWFILFLCYVCVAFYLHVCLCVTCLHGAHRVQKRELYTLELESQTIISCQVGAEIWNLGPLEE